MYQEKDFDRYPYFKQFTFEHILDSLTGIVARGFIIDYAKELIKEKKPFAMCIVDIDNFKLINDNYGHQAGDEVLKTIASDLAACVGERGLVGRYGGDEFLILFLDGHGYDETHAFVKTLYGPGKAIRRTVCLDKIHPFLTATTGAASFPDDAKDYDELFKKVDKALYRGKIKGRNCYITYVEEKHGHIDVHKKDKQSMLVAFEDLARIVQTRQSVHNKIKQIVDYAFDLLGVTRFIIFDPTKEMAISNDKPGAYKYKCVSVDEMEKLLGHKSYYSSSGQNPLSEIKTSYIAVRKYTKDHDILSMLLYRVDFKNDTNGYILVYESSITRIWQERDIALLMYIEKLIEIIYLENGVKEG
ncbi:MAG: GGDEF domain-containing protein [Acholeplasmatales bacterium]|nr:GGDEF domain-containing protein [Acholeplasmatales bacterium]